MPALYSRKRQNHPMSAPEGTIRGSESVLNQGEPNIKQKSSATVYGGFRKLAKDQHSNIAKLVQDEFVKTHTNRLSKLPSFLSTHLTKFNSTTKFSTVCSDSCLGVF